MKNTLLILLAFFALGFASCGDDDGGGSGSDSDYPQTVNIKFEVSTTRNTEALINRTLNNETITDEVESLPYSFTYAQQEVLEYTYLQMTYRDDGQYTVSSEGSSWTDYEAELKISVNNEVVKMETFTIEEGIGNVNIDYTFE